MKENEITQKKLSCAFKVHTALGSGLLESAYHECLFYELKEMGFKVEKEKSVPLMYNDVKMEVDIE